jgi:hypothetical protein
MTEPNWVLTVARKIGTQTYEGFILAPDDGGTWFIHCEKIVIVFYDGGNDIYALEPENPNALEELKRFLRSELQLEDDDYIIRIYNQEKECT